MDIGSTIKKQRELKKWSQDDLADELHISRQSISKWELGKVYPGIDMLVMMSDIFDITLDELIKKDKNFKKTIIETYSTSQIDRPMNVWEFLSVYWWLVFPFGVMLAMVVGAF